MKGKRLVSLLALGAVILSGPKTADAWFWEDIKNAAESVAGGVKSAASAAADVAVAASRGDFDAVASNVINQMTQPGIFRDQMLNKLNSLAPSQVKGFTTKATDLCKAIDDKAGEYKAKTYRSLYETYKNDVVVFAEKVRTGDLDYKEFSKYNMWYEIANSDWSSPSAAKASALRIATAQYDMYAFYSAHTLKGAAIGVARDEVGLTDEAIVAGVQELAEKMKDNAELKEVGGLIAAEFLAQAMQDQEKFNSWFYLVDNKHDKVLVAGDRYDQNVYHQNPGGRDNALWKLDVVGSGSIGGKRVFLPQDNLDLAKVPASARAFVHRGVMPEIDFLQGAHWYIYDKKHRKALVAGDRYDQHVYHQNPDGRKNAEWRMEIIGAGVDANKERYLLVYLYDCKHEKALVTGDRYDQHVYHQDPGGRKNAEWRLYLKKKGLNAPLFWNNHLRFDKP